MKRWKVIFLCICAFWAGACSVTRSLKDGEYLLRKNQVKVDDPSFDAASLMSYIAQKPNSYLLGVNPLLSVYNWGGDGKTKMGRFVQSVGVAPVVYDPALVEKSISSIGNHLHYIGYYGSQVESQVQVKGRKVYVSYYVALGKRYTISAIDYVLPEYGTIKQEFMEDLPHSTVAVGDFLAESDLEKEAERSALMFRNKGYYGLTKSYYLFDADTLAHDGTAKLTYNLRDYALGDPVSTAKPHQKFTLGKVNISHPEKLKIRRRTLQNMNTLRPGQLYSEQEVNTTYTRLANLGMLSGVNVSIQPTSDKTVDADITLRNSRLQAIKADLEGSFNSTGLFGISPQINYYHKNIFHGGERLNVGVKGNFQFKPGSNAYSTEVGITTSIRFPQFLGLPNRVFKGTNIPTTDVSLAFTYQDRPEFRRTLISTAFTYNGRVGQNFFYQFSLFRLNIARLFNIQQDFLAKIIKANPFIMNAYMGRFDHGISGTVYYTTNASAVPLTPYHYVRFSLDTSGNLLSLFNKAMPLNDDGERTIWSTPYAQYVRAELNLGKTFRFGGDNEHAIALHLMAGAGYGYGNSTTLPVEKQFYCGGSSSMRGWQARTLGPGNSQLITVFSIPTQIGEMKLEANVEYRFPIVWKLEGALFADAGNIWNMPRPADYDYVDDDDKLGVFDIKNFAGSIGLDWGLGIRVNLGFLLIRLDGGLRLHDPARAAGNRWVPVREWFPRNYAIHFGVGYPF